MKFTDCPDYDFATDSLSDFTKNATSKFTKGQIEHGGSILEPHKSLIHEAKGEVIDQMFYIYGIEEKIKGIIKNLDVTILHQFDEQTLIDLKHIKNRLINL